MAMTKKNRQNKNKEVILILLQKKFVYIFICWRIEKQITFLCLHTDELDIDRCDGLFCKLLSLAYTFAFRCVTNKTSIA